MNSKRATKHPTSCRFLTACFGRCFLSSPLLPHALRLFALCFFALSLVSFTQLHSAVAATAPAAAPGAGGYASDYGSDYGVGRERRRVLRQPVAVIGLRARTVGGTLQPWAGLRFGDALSRRLEPMMGRAPSAGALARALAAAGVRAQDIGSLGPRNARSVLMTNRALTILKPALQPIMRLQPAVTAASAAAPRTFAPQAFRGCFGSLGYGSPSFAGKGPPKGCRVRLEVKNLSPPARLPRAPASPHRRGEPHLLPPKQLLRISLKSRILAPLPSQGRGWGLGSSAANLSPGPSPVRRGEQQTPLCKQLLRASADLMRPASGPATEIHSASVATEVALQGSSAGRPAAGRPAAERSALALVGDVVLGGPVTRPGSSLSITVSVLRVWDAPARPGGIGIEAVLPAVTLQAPARDWAQLPARTALAVLDALQIPLGEDERVSLLRDASPLMPAATARHLATEQRLGAAVAAAIDARAAQVQARRSAPLALRRSLLARAIQQGRRAEKELRQVAASGRASHGAASSGATLLVSGGATERAALDSLARTAREWVAPTALAVRECRRQLRALPAAPAKKS